MKIHLFLAKSPVFVLARAAQRIAQGMSRALGSEGLSTQDALVLAALNFEKGVVLPSSLARTFESSRAGMSQSITRLERSGWVRRRLRDEDSRSYAIQLTPAGKAKAGKVVRIFDRVQKSFEAAAGPAALESALETAQRLPGIFS